MAEAALNPKDGAELVFVPGGAFLFGLTDAQVAAVAERFPGAAPGYLDLMRAGREVILPGLSDLQTLRFYSASGVVRVSINSERRRTY